MYDLIYPKIEDKYLIPRLLQKCSWKKIMN